MDIRTYQSVVSDLGEEMEAEAILHSSSTSPSLCCVTLGHKGLHQSAQLALLVESLPKISQHHISNSS
jgi:hypothetical protein